MAENFNFSTQVGQNWTIPAAYYQGMSQSPTAGSIAAYAGLARELGGMASDYMENRAGENKREASANAALNISKEMYGQAGFDTSALDKYLTPQPNENQSQYTARKEAVLKVLPVWVDLMKNKQESSTNNAFEMYKQDILNTSRAFQNPRRNIEQPYGGFSGQGLTPATPYGANPELPLMPELN
jgi:hypothetical protein